MESREVSKMLKRSFLLVILMFCVVAMGCAGREGGGFPHMTQTHTDLTKKNYKVIRSNVRGESSGFNLLFIPIVSPSYAQAMSNLHQNVNMDGKAAALVNVAQDKTSINLILFSVPKITVTADVIEFFD